MEICKELNLLMRTIERVFFSLSFFPKKSRLFYPSKRKKRERKKNHSILQSSIHLNKETSVNPARSIIKKEEVAFVILSNSRQDEKKETASELISLEGVKVTERKQRGRETEKRRTQKFLSVKVYGIERGGIKIDPLNCSSRIWGAFVGFRVVGGWLYLG